MYCPIVHELNRDGADSDGYFCRARLEAEAGGATPPATRIQGELFTPTAVPQDLTLTRR